MTKRRSTVWIGGLGALVVIIVLLALFWNWDWFKPIVEAQASAVLGRRTTLQHFQVGLGNTTTITAIGIRIADPKGFAPPPGSPQDFATIDRLTVQVELWKYITHRQLVVTTIEVDHPSVNIRQLTNGQKNYTLAPGNGTSANQANLPEFGKLVINRGDVSVILPKLRTNFALTLQTRPAPKDNKLFSGGELVATATGTYGGAPITGTFIGGALLSLRNTATPYPVDLRLQNGSTEAHLIGTVEDPAHLAGAHLQIMFSGQDMADLYQLTGIPIPSTPPFKISARLSYAKSGIRFDDLAGVLGSSDLEGTLTETPAPTKSGRRQVTGDLSSRRLDLTDLAGFLGGTPGRVSTPGQTAATRRKVEAANASPYFLPHKPFDLPGINAANIDLWYRGEHIINRDLPLDNLVVHLVIQNGRITLDPLNFAVGTGTIASDVNLNPVHNLLHANAHIDFRHLQLSRLMAATHSFTGNGVVGGSAHLVGTGNSVADLLGHGDGGMQLFMEHGGNISALLADLAGLQVGDAVLSALGIPRKTPVRCFIADFGLENGIVDTKTLLLATPAENILGSGTVDLADEKLHLRITTQATHFSIGSLSTPINVGGSLKNPSVLPAAGPLAARAGPAAGLAVLFPPLALLPTIRLGLGNKNACADTLNRIHAAHPQNPE
jgi:AsmA family protein